MAKNESGAGAKPASRVRIHLRDKTPKQDETPKEPKPVSRVRINLGNKKK
ncbi:hypothetical protein ABT298_33410 [Streptomyces sp. NPDC001034]